MRNAVIVLVSMLSLLGCASVSNVHGIPIAQLAFENQMNITKVEIGMGRPAIIDVMGTKVAETKDGPVANPFRSEIFQDKAGNNYEILYYVIEKNLPFQPLGLRQTAPVVLRNSTVIGLGSESLKRAKELSVKEINITIDRPD